MVEFMSWFVQHPLRILALGGIYVACWWVLRRALPTRRANALLAPAAWCVGFAAWEWLVTVRTPEANAEVVMVGRLVNGVRNSDSR